MLLRSLFTLYAALAAPLAWAAETPHSGYIPPQPAGVSSGSMLQMVVSLLLVLGAVFAVAWVLKRINLPQQGGAGALKVLSGVAVGQRERIVLVEVNDTWLVVGVAPGRVNALHSMPKGAMPAASGTADATSERNFQSWLKQMMEKRNV